MNNERHQSILGFLHTLITLYLGFKPIGRVFMAGYQMKLPDADSPGREPDLLVVLNEHFDRIKPTYLAGPADLVVEIVSPESIQRDYMTKFDEYEKMGVTEYWLMDPQRQAADIYHQAEGQLRRLPMDSQGRLISVCLPGFALDPALLWAETPPQGLALIELAQAMTA
jgi:Uma2 family endonuclease